MLIEARPTARSVRAPVIMHHVHGWGLRTDMSRPTRTLYLALERLCAKFTDRMIAVSKRDIQKGIDHHIGREDQYTLIYKILMLFYYR